MCKTVDSQCSEVMVCLAALGVVSKAMIKKTVMFSIVFQPPPKTLQKLDGDSNWLHTDPWLLLSPVGGTTTRG